MTRDNDMTETPLITERGYVFMVENIIDNAEREVELDSGNVIDLLVDQTQADSPMAISYLRYLLTQSRHAGRWPEAEEGGALPTDPHI